MSTRSGNIFLLFNPSISDKSGCFRRIFTNGRRVHILAFKSLIRPMRGPGRKSCANAANRCNPVRRAPATCSLEIVTAEPFVDAIRGNASSEHVFTGTSAPETKTRPAVRTARSTAASARCATYSSEASRAQRGRARAIPYSGLFLSGFPYCSLLSRLYSIHAKYKKSTCWTYSARTEKSPAPRTRLSPCGFPPSSTNLSC